MLSNSINQDDCANFINILSDISDEVLQYYFSSERGYPPTTPFKYKIRTTDLYTFVYDHCTSKPVHDEKMFDLYKAALQKHLLKHMAALNSSISSGKLIPAYNLIWDSYTAFTLLLLKRVFSYLVTGY